MLVERSPGCSLNFNPNGQALYVIRTFWTNQRDGVAGKNNKKEERQQFGAQGKRTKLWLSCLFYTTLAAISGRFTEGFFHRRSQECRRCHRRPSPDIAPQLFNYAAQGSTRDLA